MNKSLFILVLCLLVEKTVTQPRAQVVEDRCGTEREHNTTAAVPNFVGTMERLSGLMRTTRFGTTKVGTGPDAYYGLGQCYGDLNLLDCVLCYGEGRARLARCFTFNSRRVYLDGCFMRVENHTFYDEISGPEDKNICGNTTTKDAKFQESARRALLDAVTTAPNNEGFAGTKVSVSGSKNESAYVLANCWKTLNASSCRACLDNASASLTKCLPWSEGRRLNTGCFLRYSDRDFLNSIQRGGGSKISRGVVIAIVASSVAVVVIGAVIGLTIRKNMILQRKRRGSSDIVKMSRTLNDSSLNFKFSTLRKATGNFDDANKLGQGGFGIVYMGVLADGREIAVKRLFVNNRQRASDFYNEVNLISSIEHKNLVRGYMAPEYLAYGQLTEKADVYSYGLLILETITGRQINRVKNNDFSDSFSDSLVLAAWKHFQQGTSEEIFDPNLMLHNYSNSSYMKIDILRVLHVGLLCTQELSSFRPFMSTVLKMLSKRDEQLPIPTNPPFTDERTMELNDTSEDPSHPLNASFSPSIANMSHSAFYPR
ncbi:hypothetical protein IFM89_037211 [Coptis chinensis]|uniref:Cysteine-rich receptor-like protein kinase 2 n=1 Tax=Coptis chinensis TaxID=261450 RepID=A0A835I0Q4_9MAGN|nr:hypothetical protein IFM89_037211 [Coptis chinensis]